MNEHMPPHSAMVGDVIFIGAGMLSGYLADIAPAVGTVSGLMSIAYLSVRFFTWLTGRSD